MPDQRNNAPGVPRLALRGTAELGEALGISEDTAAKIAPFIPCVRLGRLRLYATEDVVAWLKASAEKAL